MASRKLQSLFADIAQTTSEKELRSRFIGSIGSYFQSQRWGIYLYNTQGQLSSVDTYGIRNVEAFVQRYQSVGKAVDPVLKYVSTYHAPAHEGFFYQPKEWKRSALYTRCCASMDHAHLMTGPVVGNGRLTGAIYFARTTGTPAFQAQNIRELGAVCAHMSAQLATFRPTPVIEASIHSLLTNRERQVAMLVAEGLTNKEISQQLWVSENTVKQALKKIFRKLCVSNRAGMVSKLLSEKS